MFNGMNGMNEGDPISFEIQAITKFANPLFEEISDDLKKMRLDPEDVRHKYLKIHGRYEDLLQQMNGAEVPKDLQEAISYLEDAFSQYERKREDFDEAKEKAVYRVQRDLNGAADMLLSQITRLSNEGSVGEKIVESKKGIRSLVDFTQEISKNSKAADIESAISDIASFCELDARVDTSPLSPQEKEDLYDRLKKIQGALEDLVTELNVGARYFDEIDSPDYVGISEKMVLLSRKAGDAEESLDQLRKKLG